MQTVHIPKPAESAAEVMDLFRNALNSRTRVLAISHVITGSGAILPVKQMCAEARSRGILTVLDGAQAVGQIAVDLADMAATRMSAASISGCLPQPDRGPCI